VLLPKRDSLAGRRRVLSHRGRSDGPLSTAEASATLAKRHSRWAPRAMSSAR